MKKIMIMTALVIGILSQIVLADIPGTINYQGRLTDGDGNVVADGTFGVTFTLHYQETGNSPTGWSEVQSISTKNGYFNIALGSQTSLSSLSFEVPYYLEAHVAGDSLPMSPRQKLKSVPYAMRADTVTAVPQVHSGERDVTNYSSGIAYIQLERMPRKITLVLHLKQFNSIYYRELARHTHAVATSSTTGNDNAGHSHYLRVGTGYGSYAPGYQVAIGSGGDHLTTGWVGDITTNHTHNFSINTTAGATGGNDGSVAISGEYTAKSYLSLLKIKINGVERTSDIVSRAQAKGQISDGNLNNTDAININIGDFAQWQIGENSVEFYQDAAGGGKVIYDLYIWY